MLSLAVLGRVEARRDGAVLAVPGGLTTQLLVRLALDHGRPVTADRLLADLWPGGAGRNTLQAKVSQLRRVMGAALGSDAIGYVLSADSVDVEEAGRLADEGAALLAAGDPVAAADRARRGSALFGPEILPAAGDWAQPHRARLEEVRLRLAEDGLAAAVELGEARAIPELETLVAAHPLRERPWALLVRALYGAGRQADALAAHRRVTRLLAEELGVDPGPELRAVGTRVLAQDPDLAPRPAPARPRAGNLPTLLGGLVGRAAELAELAAALGSRPLVTLVGPAGVGKTRLAIEAAARDRAPDGAWLVRCDAAEPATALADAVPGVETPADLRGMRALVVLDNCEHVVAEAGELATAVVGAGVRVLATSQRPLGLPGETVLTVRPLPADDAAALFVHRARERGATVAPGPELTALCAALDGLPLALELAAARTRILGVGEITRRLDDRFALLADPSSAAPERRRTLAAALAWSYDLLFPDDQRGLEAIAAFPGGATLPAVEHVLAALGVPAAAALDVVDRLADRSLVTVDDGRYRLLDSIRAFALARGDGTATAALVDWVAGLADTVEAGVRGPGQAELVAVVARERVTVDAALDAADPEVALRIAARLGWAWVLLDDAGAAARLHRARTGAPDAPADLRVRAAALEAWLEAMSNDLGPARASLDTAAAQAGADPDLGALVDWVAGFVLFQEGRPGEAVEALRRCRPHFAARGDRWWEGGSLLLEAFALLALGEIDAGREACAAAVAMVSPLGDAWGLLHAEAALGRAAQAMGRSADAARHHGRAAEAAERLGFDGAAALHLSHLGAAQLAAGDPGAAATLDRAVAGAERAGDRRMLAMARVARAEVFLAAGAVGPARDLLVAARDWYAAAGAGDGARRAEELLAGLAAAGPR